METPPLGSPGAASAGVVARRRPKAPAPLEVARARMPGLRKLPPEALAAGGLPGEDLLLGLLDRPAPGGKGTSSRTPGALASPLAKSETARKTRTRGGDSETRETPRKVGAPRREIDLERARQLRALGLTVEEVAAQLRVSRASYYRRLEEAALEEHR